jgi:hypothetical protein
MWSFRRAFCDGNVKKSAEAGGQGGSMKRHTLNLLLAGLAGLLLLSGATPASQAPRNAPAITVYSSPT